MNLDARARSAATLAVLAVVFVAGLAWAWSSVTTPFPEKEETPDCFDTAIPAGEKVHPHHILVSVLNASKREGLARDTMDALERHGFGAGNRGNASTDTGGGGAQVWTTDPDGPAALLVKSYLGPRAEIIDQASSEPGITIVVGDEFPGVVKGRRGVTAEDGTSVCSPPEPGAAG